ncbi:MAG: DUF547 domain-containing protein [Elusimicrobia bacterium]|nr:DUF547 domain-containing protein [Elusimicrobiota bacterium]
MRFLGLLFWIWVLLVAAGRVSDAGAALDHTHSLWGEVLSRYNHEGLVDYRGLRENPELLRRYLRSLASVDSAEYASWKRGKQLAFWINAYNSQALQIVADHYPIRPRFPKSWAYPKNSIQQIPGVWKEIYFDMAGRRVALDDIEHEILRKGFREPRIHFALVCASLGCPKLQPKPFEASRLEQQLEQAAREFIQDPKKAHWESRRRILRLSPIFSWFGEDFGNPQHFILRYLPEEPQRRLSRGAWKIEWLEYDWSLNEWRGGDSR